MGGNISNHDAIDLISRNIDSDISDDSQDEQKKQELNVTKKRKLNCDESDDDDDDDDNDEFPSDFEEIALDDSIISSNNVSQRIDVVTLKNVSSNGSSEKTTDFKLINRLKSSRFSMHCMHMISLMIHLYIRNQWLQDQELQKILKKKLSKDFRKKVKKFFERTKTSKEDDDQVQLAKEFHKFVVNLTRWFQLNFRLEGHGLRHNGYLKDPLNLKSNDYYYNFEPIESLQDFKILYAKQLKGNRDIAVQLFVSLLRGLGFEVRLCFSLPLLGYSLDKADNAIPLNYKKKSHVSNDKDMLFPTYWCEVSSPSTPEIFVVDLFSFTDFADSVSKLTIPSLVKLNHLDKNELIKSSFVNHFEPRGKYQGQMKMWYVVSIDSQNYMLDTSSRYLKNICFRYFPLRCLQYQNQLEHGKKSFIWFKRILMIINGNKYQRKYHVELETLHKLGLINFDKPVFSRLRSSNNFVTPSLLYNNEFIDTSKSKAIGFLKISSSAAKKEPFYYQSSIIKLKTETSWKLLGRQLKPNVEPLKVNNYNPRTIKNKRKHNISIYDENVNTEDIIKQELYSYTQTEPYKAAIINFNNQLPRNKYGNIEIFTRNMIPKGTVVIELPNIVEIMEEHNNHKKKKINY
ncbi:hypothetical protein PACTADRAFT_185605 [Pachysolen tannophilus NRRL Y-2460]|uniref:Rad4 beta-hairpin domain-containing protein n=1 Tax=Pachysolen tannophilus NRRL Y-2460 TaxID=669874 RepID=A0A1E4U213_PACTA|nr:hypothetical protein PACTADRAFT_185605 [Pachysolen tannophilus NRRL Y-2460]